MVKKEKMPTYRPRQTNSFDGNKRSKKHVKSFSQPMELNNFDKKQGPETEVFDLQIIQNLDDSKLVDILTSSHDDFKAHHNCIHRPKSNETNK